MSKAKQTKGFNLPKPKHTEELVEKLPNNGIPATSGSIVFSLTCFSREHKLFNLGGESDDGTVGGAWFIDLMDCLKDVSNKKISEIKTSIHDLHPVKWSSANTSAPDDQHEYWQFRLNKSKGRVIGFIVHELEYAVFYIVWLDPHHNLTNSDGYGGIDWYKSPLSEYEKAQNKIKDLESELEQKKRDYETLKKDSDDLYSEYSKLLDESTQQVNS